MYRCKDVPCWPFLELCREWIKGACDLHQKNAGTVWHKLLSICKVDAATFSEFAQFPWRIANSLNVASTLLKTTIISRNAIPKGDAVIFIDAVYLLKHEGIQQSQHCSGSHVKIWKILSELLVSQCEAFKILKLSGNTLEQRQDWIQFECTWDPTAPGECPHQELQNEPPLDRSLG